MAAQLLTDKEVAQYLGVSRSTVWRCMSNPDFPQPLRLSSRITRWRATDIENYISKGAVEQ